MRFNILGPLEIVGADGTLVATSGVKQRATLGFLLLHANKVVATSRLLKALWDEDQPVTARKMLQNAVSGLRAILPADGSVRLETHAPGYVLRVDPEVVDVSAFYALVDKGTANLAAGAWDQAARVLREALGLWRGPVLADLTETGIAWPELTLVGNARLAAYEHCVEAELAAGRHHEVIGELEALVEAEPQRERLCGQLMLALYRSGRQADALSVYRRTKAALVDELGLDPGRELQDLERSILDHDPALGVPRPAVQPPAAPVVVTARLERKRVSALLVRVGLDESDPEDIDEAQRGLSMTVRGVVETFGGSMRGMVGSVWLAVFGVPRTDEHDAERAARAAMAIRDRLAPNVTAYLAVTTGEALVRYGDDEVTGRVLDSCLRLLALVPPGEVRVCDATRQATEHTLGYHTGSDFIYSGAFDPSGPRDAADEVPFLERERDLEVLGGLLGDVHRRQRPHLVTVFGEAGIGKSRLISELAGTVRDEVRWVFSRSGPFAQDGPVDTTCAALGAWKQSLEDLAATEPLVLVLEDLHWADDAMLDFVEGLTAHTGPVPLLVIATARPELLQRRPRWGGGNRDATTLTLDPLSSAAAARLLGQQDSALVARIGGNPRFAVEYARMLNEGVPPVHEPDSPPLSVFSSGWVASGGQLVSLPQSVHSVIAAQLDSLPDNEKAVLQDAAVVGDLVCANAVAAVSELDHIEAARSLEYLESREFLQRGRQKSKTGGATYEFRQALVRDVAYSQLPRAVRAHKEILKAGYHDSV